MTKHSRNGILKQTQKKKTATPTETREHSLEPWFLKNYGTGNIFTCSAASKENRIFSILALTASII